MADVSTLAIVASIIAGFGGLMLSFRIQRELQMHEELEARWIPWADRLLIAATLVALLLVLLPLLACSNRPGRLAELPAAACAAAVVMFAGYILSILAHYRIILRFGRSGPRRNPEPAEKWLVLLAAALAVLLLAAVFFRYPPPVQL
jgi:hypothetical protein